MSMSADIVAIGPFCGAIVPALPYSSSNYAETREGVLVVTHICQVFDSALSRKLAACLGISDPWDFNQHAFDPQQVDLATLREVLALGGDEKGIWRDVNAFDLLRRHGFTFVFEPNG